MPKELCIVELKELMAHNDHDHCIICFAVHDQSFNKCQHCTAMYCQTCSDVVLNTYNNSCSVCKQPYKEGVAVNKSISKVYPEIQDLERRIENLEQRRVGWTFEKVVAVATIIICTTATVVGMVLTFA